MQYSHIAPSAILLWLVCISVPIHVQGQTDLAGSFLSGILDSITNTANSEDCPGICVHTLATLICYEVLHDVPCPSPSMKCCIESISGKNTTKSQPQEIFTRLTTVTAVTTPVTTTASSTKDIQTITKNSPAIKSTTVRVTTTTAHNIHSNCLGVCVSDHIADYCEAYLTSKGLCQIGSKCCVSLDEYPNGKYPLDIFIPAKHIPNLTKTRTNSNKTSLTHKPALSFGITQIKNITAKTTIQTSAPTMTIKSIPTNETASIKTIQNQPHPNNTKKTMVHTKGTSKPKMTKTTSTVSSMTTSTYYVEEQENQLESEYTVESGEKHDIDEDDSNNNEGEFSKQCEGECLNGILAIFCDEIDTEASCLGDNTCCVTKTLAATESNEPSLVNKHIPHKSSTKIKNQPLQNKTAATSKPTSATAIVGSDIFNSLLNFAENTLNGATNTPYVAQEQPSNHVQKCNGFCLMNIMVAFCKSPSILLNNKRTDCPKGSICCEKSVPQSRRPPPSTTQLPADPPTPSLYMSENTPIPDFRDECPGSCIVSLLSFTCFSRF